MVKETSLDNLVTPNPQDNSNPSVLGIEDKSTEEYQTDGNTGSETLEIDTEEGLSDAETGSFSRRYRYRRTNNRRATPKPIVTAQPTTLPTSTPDNSPVAIATSEPTASPTSDPEETPVITPTIEPTTLPTSTPEQTSIAIATIEPTISPTSTPEHTPISTIAPTSAPSPKPTTAPTLAGPTPTALATITPTPTAVAAAPTITAVPTPSVSASPSPTATSSPTPRPTNTPVVTAQPTVSPTPTAQVTPVATATIQPTVAPVTPSATPNSTGVKFGVVANDYMNSRGEIPALESQLGRQISTVSIFKQFGLSGNKDFIVSEMTYLKSRGIRIQIAWEPWNPEQGMAQSVDFLKAIPAGQYDAYMTEFANNIKNYGGDVMIRFGHEMNGNWYPWGQRPNEYITAYKYVHDFFEAKGVTNVTWMWCPNVIIDGNDLSSYYPGDDYVDVIGIDGFNFGTSLGYGGWQSFTSIFGDTYNYLAQTYTKPMTIAETGSSEIGGNKEAWIRTMFTTELPQKFPRIEEIIWFNILKETDWRINSSNSSLQAFIDNL